MSKNIFIGAVLALSLTACSQHYALTSITRSRILIDSTYDRHPDTAAVNFVKPYKHVVDSIMNPVVGEVAEDMWAHQPESNLSNLLADIMVWAGKLYNEKPDMGLYNAGGIRATLPKGPVTYGDILDVAPFENKICFVTLKGSDLTELFSQIAMTGGQGVSHGVQINMTPDGKLLSASLNGKAIDPNASYRIATIDYVAQGNDKLTAMKRGTQVNAPQDESNNSRYIIVKYFKELASQGKAVSDKVEGRITITK